ncbi:hypothetical protein BFP97_04705 [Roseivirga sp. 4D4]|uniref:serine hydrolase n=1 Tax=Roseivirga sp. 4D4 TaxID=1889784 RepID=UPI000853A2F9|nr:serine hydrolase [Roseivirga sp. 4D4]OEK00851.1 hypothetical protein BFP97_04705 [Roseivirga sp. 4D4]
MLLFYVVCQAQPYQQEIDRVDKFIDSVKARFSEIPGLSITIVKNNETVFTKGYGYADIESKELVSANSAFYIASATKSFIGALAVILEKEGWVDLQAPLTNYKPFKELSNHALFDDLTITHLLNHTSGLTNNFITFRSSYLGNLSHKKTIELLETATQKTDSKYEYSNLGYNLFALLLSEEFGDDWRNLLREKIFEPIRMINTSSIISNNGSMAKPYISAQPEGTIEGSMKTDALMHSAGGLVSSVADIAQWIKFNLSNGGLGNSQPYKGVISKSHKQTVKYPEEKGQIFTDNGYALGWHNGTYKNKQVVYHFGGYIGYQSHISFIPDEDLGVAVFANEQHFGDNLNSIIASYAYDLLLGLEPDETEYESKLKDLEGFIENLKNNSIERDKQTKQYDLRLSTKLEAYTGTYKNDFMGDVIVTIEKETLSFRFGELSAIAVPTANEDMILAELIPGRPMDFLFHVTEQGEVKEISGGGLQFVKVE